MILFMFIKQEMDGGIGMTLEELILVTSLCADNRGRTTKDE